MQNKKVARVLLAVILAVATVCSIGCESTSDNRVQKHIIPTGSMILPDSDTTLRPTSAITPQLNTPTPTEAVTPGEPEPVRRVSRKGYTIEQIAEYFDEVALNAEYGSSDHRVHKWNSPIILCVKGAPTTQDRLVLQTILWKMNAVYGFPGIRETISEAEANLVITFADDNEYAQLTPSNIDDLTDGFATCWWQNSVIYKADIGIRCSISQNERNSVIWEEMIQATGLQNDSYRYPDSLFYQGYNEVQEPTTLDWILFELLYHPDMSAGLSRPEAIMTSTLLLE